jgi:pilus assembly protein Flp/PilA
LLSAQRPGVKDYKHTTPDEELHMLKAWNQVRRLAKDEEGAALIEYTVLLGILVVAVIATIIAVGGWVNNKWTALNTALS